MHEKISSSGQNFTFFYVKKIRRLSETNASIKMTRKTMTTRKISRLFDEVAKIIKTSFFLSQVELIIIYKDPHLTDI